MVMVTKATLSKTSTLTSSIMRLFSTGFYGLGFLMDDKSTVMQTKRTMTKVQTHEVKEFLNIVDNSIVSRINEMDLPKIKEHHLIYVPRTEPDFDLLRESINLKQKAFEEKSKVKMNRMWSESSSECDYEYEYAKNLKDDKKFDKSTNFHTKSGSFDSKTHVQVRLMYDGDNFPFDFKNLKIRPVRGLENQNCTKQEPVSGWKCVPCVGQYSPEDDDTGRAKKLEPIEEIIVHVHGGGFVGMSSASHMVCTRSWAKKTKVPIFSIDYKVAPEDPYPASIQDCWEAYRWIVKYAEKHMNIKPSKIIMIGDSAGGNLIASLAILAIVSGLTIPEKLIMAYPALDLSLHRFYPSLINGVNDILLNFNLMKFMRDKYIGETSKPESDPLLSPYVT